MKFKGYKSWLTEGLDEEGVTVLYPGGFKPMTGGHIELIKKYAEHPDVKEVRVLIGPGIRDGITQTKAFVIADRLVGNMSKVKIEAVKWPSPVLTAYKIVEEAPSGTYALAASSKEQENEKRIKDFVFKHSPEGKFNRPGINVIELSVDINPTRFEGRDDEHEGEPISASVLRNDIVNDDLDNFITGYPNIDPDDIDFVWSEVAETIMNESALFEWSPIRVGSGTTSSSPGNYDRSQTGYFYRSLFPILEDGEEPDMIEEGGGAGHMMSPWEAADMTFGEIRQFIQDALGGKLQNVTEKLDGQNLMITVKNGDVYLARTQKQMRDGGKLAVKWDEVKDNLGEKTPEFVKKAFQEAANDLQTIFRSSKLDLDNIFRDGHRWLNIELLNPETENIVPYGEFQLRIHNMRELSDNGKEVDTIWEGGDLDKIINDIEFSQASGDLDKIHLVKKTNSVNFEKIKDVENIQESIISKMEVLMAENNLDDKNTIGDYLAAEIRSWLEESIEDKELIEDLVQRWAYGSKVKNIGAILKGKDQELSNLIKSLDKNIDDRIGRYLDPIIEIFSRIGIAVLQNVSGIAASNKDAVSAGIKKKAEEAINKIQEFILKDDVGDTEDYEKKVNYLETQLRRIEQAGGLEGIAPLEGIVFEYNGKLFKLTGNYLPLLKIINFFQFGRDK